ncbi:hypothetical protein [Sphingomonas sp. VNH70]|uniref:hypothetical protein n=1 Tax=Sphingomonas silueang TaxID=3156617 RepID=UPI0032B5B421
MGDVFLHVPERLAGYPVTLDEAVGVLLKRVYGADFRLWTPTDKAVEMAQRIWEGVCLNLATNDLHSFAQADDTGSWYRIPSEYWGDWWLLSNHIKWSPPSALLPIAKVDWVPDHLNGAAVVVWQADVDRLADTWDAAYARYKAVQDDQQSERDAGQEAVETPNSIAPRPASQERLRKWITARNADGWSQTRILKEVSGAFPDNEVPGRSTLVAFDVEARNELGLEPRKVGRGKKGK